MESLVVPTHKHARNAWLSLLVDTDHVYNPVMARQKECAR